MAVKRKPAGSSKRLHVLHNRVAQSSNALAIPTKRLRTKSTVRTAYVVADPNMESADAQQDKMEDKDMAKLMECMEEGGNLFGAGQSAEDQAEAEAVVGACSAKRRKVTRRRPNLKIMSADSEATKAIKVYMKSMTDEEWERIFENTGNIGRTLHVITGCSGSELQQCLGLVVKFFVFFIRRHRPQRHFIFDLQAPPRWVTSFGFAGTTQSVISFCSAGTAGSVTSFLIRRHHPEHHFIIILRPERHSILIRRHRPERHFILIRRHHPERHFSFDQQQTYLF